MYVADARDLQVAKRYFTPFVERFRNQEPVLELASGKGIFQDLLKEAGIQGVGVEMDDDLCQSCQQRGLQIIKGDLFSHMDSVAEGHYGGCLASHIVEHFLPQQVDEMFHKAARVVRPGGILVVITPNIANLRRAAGDFWRDPTHVRPYPIAALHKLLRKNQWEMVDSGECTDRPTSVKRTIVYTLRNVLLGRYWGGDDVWVVAKRLP
ncbi:MAG: class I SAM-dependent methyltransferase [Magnetococcales bacterium]|nr:methyltransferase domain-containing protein [Magnetococcales bacterium]NGZ27892.1 class I SAM-dependent methyltransferase [Magnetococcales bacterium]